LRPSCSTINPSADFSVPADHNQGLSLTGHAPAVTVFIQSDTFEEFLYMTRYKWSLLSVAALALAAHAAETPQPQEGGAVMVSPFSGLKAGIDKQTGKLRPLTAEESKALDQKKFDSAAYTGWRIVSPPDEATAIAQARTLANGTVVMKVPETHQNYLVVTRSADGKLVLSHTGEASATHSHPVAKKETVRE
jgi:hypothetical protein